MKIKQSLIALLLLLLFPSFASASVIFIDDHAAKAKTPIDGFRGIKWGEPASKYRDELKFLENQFFNSKAKTYTRPDEKPTIGGAYIGGFEYSFDEKGFYQAVASFSYYSSGILRDYRLGENAPQSYFDVNNRFLKIYDACVKQWGTPKKEVVQKPRGYYSSEYRWYTPITLPGGKKDFAVAELTIMYKPPHNNPFAVILEIYSLDGKFREEDALEAFREKRNREF